MLFPWCNNNVLPNYTTMNKSRNNQWGTQKIFMREFSFSGIWWSFVFGVRFLWRHCLTSNSCFQTYVLEKFVDIIGIFFCSHSPHVMCHCTEYKLSPLQVTISEENKLNATTQQFIIAKISGCVLKQGSKTHSSQRQSNLQLQNEAALMSCRIRAVEHRKCTAGLAGAHPSLQDRILQNYTEIENAHKARKKTFNFVSCIEVQQFFLFPCWDSIKCSNASTLKTAIFELLQQFYHAT